MYLFLYILRYSSKNDTDMQSAVCKHSKILQLYNWNLDIQIIRQYDVTAYDFHRKLSTETENTHTHSHTHRVSQHF